jgi:hypothetical protein
MTPSEQSAIRTTPLGGTRYEECPDYPGICKEYPAPCRGETRTMPSFRRIPKED